LFGEKGKGRGKRKKEKGRRKRKREKEKGRKKGKGKKGKGKGKGLWYLSFYFPAFVSSSTFFQATLSTFPFLFPFPFSFPFLNVVGLLQLPEPSRCDPPPHLYLCLPS